MKVLKKKQLQIAIAAGLCAGLIACSDSDNVQVGGNGDGTGDGTNATLNLTLTGLDDLGADYVYEGWLLVNGTPVTTGRFTSAAGEVQSASVEDAEAATKYILTIEPAAGDDPAPANTHVLAGDLVGTEATLTIGDPAAVGNDFVDSTGSFIIATPSDPDASYTQGLWWLDGSTTPPTAGLNLPTLAADSGWVYEGWVKDPDGAPVSTGTFSDPATADSDAGGPDAGSVATPGFPGQDFVDPARVITGAAAIISVEPFPDNSPAPFGIKPLIDGVIEDVGEGGTQDMANVIGENQPSGTLTIQLP